MIELLNLEEDAKKQIKKMIWTHCINVKKTLCNELSESVVSIKDSVEGNDKSSAGDKHETSRENANQTLLIYGEQMKKAMEDLMLLNMIKPEKMFTNVQLGALVVLNGLVLYIADNLNQFPIKNVSVNIVSPNAPFVKQILGKNVGFKFSFNNKEYQILEVF
ncbi:MAG: hypothetical protein ACKOX3_12290 [Bacteroidota bacterium]